MTRTGDNPTSFSLAAKLPVIGMLIRKCMVVLIIRSKNSVAFLTAPHSTTRGA
jgi:hypothetical protein